MLAGTAAVWLGSVLAARQGRLAAVTALTVLGSSYLLIHYSSEARGYAWLLLFTCAALETLLRWTDTRRAGWVITFWVTSLLGLLAHPLFAHVSAGTAIWTLFYERSRRPKRLDVGQVPGAQPHRLDGGRQTRGGSCLACAPSQASWSGPLGSVAWVHGPPLTCAAVLWKARWSVMELGGGPPYSLASVLVETASLAGGGPALGAGAGVAAALVLAGVIVGVRTWRRAPLGWLSGIIMGLPLLQVLVAPPPFLFPRYFLVTILLGQLSLSVALAAWYRRGRWGRWGYAAALACFLFGQTWHTVRLVQTGRGPVRAALAFMASQSPRDPIVISSDHNFGIGKLVAFYRTEVQPARTFVYVGGESWPAAGPDWLVRHGEATSLPGWKRVERVDGHTFCLERVFACAPYSGWYWACYRRLETRPGTAGPGTPGNSRPGNGTRRVSAARTPAEERPSRPGGGKFPTAMAGVAARRD